MSNEGEELTPQRRAILLAALAAQIAKLIKANKAALSPDVPAGRTDRVLIDGEVVGTVGRSVGSRSIITTDEEALIEWCDRFHPSEVEMITRIRPAFLETLTMTGDVVVDKLGNIVDGLAVATGTGHLVVTQAKDKADLLWSAVRNNVLELTGPTDE